jgi:Holliday junction resolvase RusA-like endonuclease
MHLEAELRLPAAPAEAWAALPAEARRRLPEGPIKHPVRLHIRLVAPLPDLDREDQELARRGQWRPGGPTVPELLRGLLDAARGCLIDGDGDVAEAIVEKFFGADPRVELRVFSV